jgi:hypothetical protein
MIELDERERERNVLLSSSEEWIEAIEKINRITTPHLQQVQVMPMNNADMKMVTNDDADNTENEYPLMSEIFARRPVCINKSNIVISC